MITKQTNNNNIIKLLLVMVILIYDNNNNNNNNAGKYMTWDVTVTDMVAYLSYLSATSSSIQCCRGLGGPESVEVSVTG